MPYGIAAGQGKQEPFSGAPTVWLPFAAMTNFLAPLAWHLMILGASAAAIGYVSSRGVIGRMKVSTEFPVLFGGLGVFLIGFMTWLA
ncbi:hypothetical protein [Rhodococcus opacus]|uniref:Uncharacterized protein n=1 Tax=Rhodococcus opacus TaxID=37919 RepID=A0A2S8IGY3_RHOOP|nr:hypothetical protein [Rhodococcus opacus]PQP14028.1 hypothetical protein C5613_41380 [Rhodococcus opacus]